MLAHRHTDGGHHHHQLPRPVSIWRPDAGGSGRIRHQRCRYGLITSGFLLAYGIGQLISGPWIDRLGTKRGFSYGAIFWSLATILQALGRGLWSFFTLRVILGLAEAANFPAVSEAVA